MARVPHIDFDAPFAAWFPGLSVGRASAEALAAGLAAAMTALFVAVVTATTVVALLPVMLVSALVGAVLTGYLGLVGLVATVLAAIAFLLLDDLLVLLGLVFAAATVAFVGVLALFLVAVGVGAALARRNSRQARSARDP